MRKVDGLNSNSHFPTTSFAHFVIAIKNYSINGKLICHANMWLYEDNWKKINLKLSNTNPYNACIFLFPIAVNITTNRKSSCAISFIFVSRTHFITPCHWHIVNYPSNVKTWSSYGLFKFWKQNKPATQWREWNNIKIFLLKNNKNENKNNINV